ncbi:aromatic ring-hydroxylating dioxygenase subunit alpha [Sphingomonas sp. CGMCC 1.13654]|uniref:Aromatic ring-hydroxylating dioxygenase subunit alpha n=1 Tax=Sphingomonas chungangi TaxID=2683589 RepID=A0A838L3K6_9SPHN|nr:aromatic ring-hydroxylating dioxygenase subunit alpha [Sphingomonas chungangi]MBA2933971.1 aromatic ring-hydroxylating dioxygenase subunit alpha [Sphingomonas chungangi]MVW57096.1 Rieske 2Fe-2S domain-containing protein [Sphingomonas chungangi]
MATLLATPPETPHHEDGLADEDTPFIFDAWYVVCLSDEIEAGKPVARRLLGINVVLYRTASGAVVAMRDRCPHRSFPLSASAIEGDDIVCGYHGIRYGPDGACKAVPTQKHAPKVMRVQTYAVRETAPMVWIWLGDPGRAATTALPPCEWATRAHGWALSAGSMTLHSNYVFLHENLLDLSHLSFLHKKTFGTPDYAAAPFSTDIGEDRIVVRRTVAPTRLPPLYADPLDIHGDAARIVTSTYHSPGLSVSAVVLQNLELPEGERTDHHIRTAQLLTPIDRDHVLYHFVIARDFVKDDAQTSETIHAGIKAAFVEDCFALENIARNRREDEAPFVERSITSDKAGVMLRRRLRSEALAERG